MAKIVGMMGNIDGFRTAIGFMSSPIFTNACKSTSKALNKPLAELFTKRQASKFRRGKGIVYETLTKETNNA